MEIPNLYASLNKCFPDGFLGQNPGDNRTDSTENFDASVNNVVTAIIAHLKGLSVSCLQAGAILQEPVAISLGFNLFPTFSNLVQNRVVIADGLDILKSTQSKTEQGTDATQNRCGSRQIRSSEEARSGIYG